MASDPALANDSSTYLEAIAGDNGVHDPNAVFWLSPDIQLTGATSGADKADPGAVNSVQVTFHAGATGNLPPGTEGITVDLFVANPSLVMAPNNPQSTALINSMLLPVQPPGGSQSWAFQWTPPSGAAPDDPQAPGHKCLIARAYADPLTPSSMNFFLPGDRHVGQHNICIVPCGGSSSARKAASCSTRVNTINVWKKPQKARLRATLDVEPAKGVREFVLARLKRVKGFERLAPRGPKSFGFTFSGVKARDVAPPKAAKGKVVESEVRLEPEQFVTFAFGADLSGGKTGDAHVFHLTHAGDDGRVHGGLTVVLLAV